AASRMNENYHPLVRGRKKGGQLAAFIHRRNAPGSTHPGIAQRRRREVPRRGAIAVLVGLLLVAHADGDVAAGDDVVQRLEGICRQLVLVVLQQVGFTYAPQLATAVVQLRLDNGPAVLVDEEAPLGVDVALAALERGFDLPDTVQLVAR